MIITCPSCATRYKVPDGAFGAEGRDVRCKSCAFEWLAIPDDMPPKPSKAAANPAAPTKPASRPMAEEEPVPAIDMESAARNREKTAKKLGRLRRMEWPGMAIAASLLIGVLSLYPLRNTITYLIPAAEPIYKLAGIQINLVGFDFSDVHVAREYDSGLPVLTVKGNVVNVSDKPMPVPRVRFGLRDGAQQEIYHWTVAVSDEPLVPGAQARFSTKLAAPPKEAREILLRFNGGAKRQQAFLFSTSREK